MKRLEFAKALDAFLQEEGAVAYATKSRLDGKLVHGEAICSGLATPSIPGCRDRSGGLPAPRAARGPRARADRLDRTPTTISAKLDQFVQPTYDPDATDRRIKRLGFAKAMDAFLQEEGAVAYATKSRLDGKLVHGEGYLFGVGDTVKTPGVEIAAEDYRRLARLAGLGLAPTVSIDSQVRFDDSDAKPITSSPISPAAPRTAAM